MHEGMLVTVDQLSQELALPNVRRGSLEVLRHAVVKARDVNGVRVRGIDPGNEKSTLSNKRNHIDFAV
jgi:hypothetical protein